MQKKERGILYALTSSIFGGVASVFAAYASKIINPVAVGGIGQLISGLLLTFYVTIRKKVNYGQILKYKKDLALLTLLRSIVGHILYLTGLSLTLAIKGVFFSKIEPYFVLFWGWILKEEKIYSRQIFLLLIHLSGAFLLSTGGNVGAFTSANIGDVIIILAMFVFAYTYYISKKLSRNIGAKTSNAVTSLSGGIVLTPIAYFLFADKIVNANPLGWLYLIIYVLFFPIISLTLWYAALKTVRGWIVSAVRVTGSIFGAIVAYLLFSETLTEIQIVGAAIVLTTSALIAREHKR